MSISRGGQWEDDSEGTQNFAAFGNLVQETEDIPHYMDSVDGAHNQHQQQQPQLQQLQRKWQAADSLSSPVVMKRTDSLSSAASLQSTMHASSRTAHPHLQTGFLAHVSHAGFPMLVANSATAGSYSGTADYGDSVSSAMVPTTPFYHQNGGGVANSRMVVASPFLSSPFSNDLPGSSAYGAEPMTFSPDLERPVELQHHQNLDPVEMHINFQRSALEASSQIWDSGSSRYSSPDTADAWSLHRAASPADSHDSGASIYSHVDQDGNMAHALEDSSVSGACQQRATGDLETARDSHYYSEAKPDENGLYHCPWEGKENCNHKPEKLKCTYDKYVDSHLKPYRCKVVSCSNARFSSTACLLRHEREAHAMHGHGEKPYNCLHAGCERALPGNGFPRQWNLKDHMRRVHRDNGSGFQALLQGGASASAPAVSRTLEAAPPKLAAKIRKRKKESVSNGKSASSTSASRKSSSSSAKSSAFTNESESPLGTDAANGHAINDANNVINSGSMLAANTTGTNGVTYDMLNGGGGYPGMVRTNSNMLEQVYTNWHENKKMLENIVVGLQPGDPHVQSSVRQAQVHLENIAHFSSEIMSPRSQDMMHTPYMGAYSQQLG